MRTLSIIVACVTLIPLVGFARGRSRFYINENVFLKPGATARADEKPVDPRTIPVPATVTKIEGESLWLGTACVLKTDAMSARAAVEFYTDETKKKPNDAVLWRNLGIAWQHANVAHDDDHAEKCFAEAIRLDPQDARIYKARASIFSGQRKYDESIKDLTEAIRLNPQDAGAFDSRATDWCWKNAFDKGIDDYGEAIRLDPENPNYYRHRAMRLYLVGDLDGYLRDYEEVIRLHEDDTGFDRKYSSACALVAMIRATWPEEKYRNAKQAIELANAANENTNHDPRRRDYGNERAIEALACASAEAGDFDTAIKLSKQSLKNWQKDNGFPRNSSYYRQTLEKLNARAELFQKREPFRDPDQCRDIAWAKATCPIEKYRDGQRAVELATLACELSNWKRFSHLEALAAAYAECGNFSKAIEWQEKAIENVTDDQSYDPIGDKQCAGQRLKSYQDSQPTRE